MPDEHDLSLLQYTDPNEVTQTLRRQLIDCWIDVTNDGGAAGFPFPPVSEHQVASVTDALINSLDPHRTRLLVAMRDDTLAGWVVLHRDTNPLVAHWGSIKHLQTHPTHRRKGLGAALMHELRRIARDELGLEQLHLAVRGGMGLENFYAQLGWHEVGRWPNALRLTADDTRDEVLMALAPL
jgi:GNAT superfamily N-acetyltransferase